MKAALVEPETVQGFATDALYCEFLPALPRLKAETDIKAGKTDKLLGDWCWSLVPKALFVQSGLAFYLDDNDKVLEVKCRGLPIKNLKRAQLVLNDILKALEASYDHKAVRKLRPKKRRDGSIPPIARHATVAFHAFMPLALSVVNKQRYDNFFCKWGDVEKTIWLDDAGHKREIDEEDLELQRVEAVQTRPRENFSEELSARRFPDWVENAIREKKRQEAAVAQFKTLEQMEEEAWCDSDDDDYEGWIGGETDSDDDYESWMNSEPDSEGGLNMLLEQNCDIEP